MAQRKPLSVCSMLLESQGSSMHWSLTVKQHETGLIAKINTQANVKKAYKRKSKMKDHARMNFYT